MPNPVLPALKDWLLKHEGDIAHGVWDFGDLRPVFEHLWGRPASQMKKPIPVVPFDKMPVENDPAKAN